MKLQLIKKYLLLLLVPGFFFTGCEKDLDHPPVKELDTDAIMTIQEIRDLYDDEPVEFTGEGNFFATVVMDENKGNIYRSLIVQDNTAGLYIRLTSPSFLNEGDSVRISLDGAVLDAYENMLQLNEIDPDRMVIKQAADKHLTPEKLTIPEITSEKQGQLIKLENVQFSFEDANKPYADAANQRALNRTLVDEDGNSIIVRTSGFADFADETTPEGSGSLIGVVSQFRNDMQLFIRKTDEVVMEDERFAPPGGDLELITIAEIRQMFADGTTNLPPNTRVEGVVISDREYQNHPGQNAYIMDENGDGIAIRFQNWHSLNYGNLIRIVTSNLPLNEFNGLLQIEEIPTGNAFAIDEGEIPEPAVTTIGNLRDNFEDYESTLIRIENVSIPSSGSFEGNIELSDGTGSVNMYTYSWAEFADDPVQGGIYNVTAIASYYYNPQLLIRSSDDLEYLGEDDDNDVDPVTEIDEDFSGFNNYEEIIGNGWNTIAEAGGRKWICRTFDGNHYAQATAFNSQDPVNIMWLLTPPVDIDAISNPVLEFQSAQAHYSHDGFGVYISTDFDGSNLDGATWEALPATLAGDDDPDHTWVDSGTIDLSGYSGIIYIGWKYEGSHPNEAGTFRVDNVKLNSAD